MSSAPPTQSSTDRKALAWSVGRIALTGVALIAFYFLLPFFQVTVLDTVIRLVGGVVLIVLVVGWQVRAIARSSRPQLRALEAVGLSFWLLVVVFSIVYVTLSTAAPQSFSEPLNEVDGLYFTMTVLSTVGFGDISALTSGARILVTVQILLDLLLLGVVVRVLIGAGKSAAAARRSDS